MINCCIINYYQFKHTYVYNKYYKQYQSIVLKNIVCKNKTIFTKNTPFEIYYLVWNLQTNLSIDKYIYIYYIYYIRHIYNIYNYKCLRLYYKHVYLIKKIQVNKCSHYVIYIVCVTIGTLTTHNNFLIVNIRYSKRCVSYCFQIKPDKYLYIE